MSYKYARVAVRQTILDYILPTCYPQVGKYYRVIVPIIDQYYLGLITSLENETSVEHHKLKLIIKVIDDYPIFNSQTVSYFTELSIFYGVDLAMLIAKTFPQIYLSNI